DRDPVKIGALLGLVKENASIRAVHPPPATKGALDHVIPAFELWVDDSSFTEQYACLVEEIPLAECGKPECPTCPEVCDDKKDNDGDGDTDCSDTDCADRAGCEQPAVEKEPKGRKGRSDTVAYTYRSYFALPVTWNGIPAPPPPPPPPPPTPDEVCDDGVDNDRDGRTDCRDLDCRDHPGCQKEKAETVVHLDVGLNASVVTMGDVTSEGLDWIADNGVVARGNIRLAVGAEKGLRGMIALNISPPYPIINDGTEFYQDATYMAGVSYGLPVSDGLELEPRLLVGLVDRAIAWDGTYGFRAMQLGLDAGASIHLLLSDGFGLYVDGGLQSSPPIEDGSELALDTSGAQFSGGAEIRF
ncbi:MAG: hypothetical protein QGG40_21430, partial [Myxococcota bacterium]|nr:hypothetical protein [Myxococcota bacterium]